MADTARTRQHQNPLTGLQATHIEQRLPGSEARKRQTTARGLWNGLRSRPCSRIRHHIFRHRRQRKSTTWRKQHVPALY